MTSVASLVVKTDIDKSQLKSSLSQYWYGNGYEVEICSQWWPSPPPDKRVVCILSYFFYRNTREHEMLTNAATYLLKITQDQLIYYPCVDFVGDLDIPDQQNRIGGVFKGNLRVDNLTLPEYAPSMTSSDIYLIVD
jgi:hypothetical protein